MEGKVKLSAMLGDRETLEGISFYTLISLCESLCDEFTAKREIGKPITYSDEFAVICDLETGKIDGESLNAAASLSGGQQPISAVKFIAPEVLRGEETDRYRSALYTLAVLIFRILTLSFPYEGREFKKTDPDSREEVRLFYTIGNDFIFDKKGKNRAVFGANDSAIAFWEIYPDDIKQAFLDIFAGGKPESRLTEEEWAARLKGLKERLSPCTECGAEMFYTACPAKCWRCLQSVYPYELTLTENGKRMLACNARCGISFEGSGYKFETVVRNMRWGIKNHCDPPWQWIKADGRRVAVEKNKAVPLKECELKLSENTTLRVTKRSDHHD